MAGNVMEMKKVHKLLARMDYELGKVERGYTNRTLYINLSDNTIKSKPVTQQMKDIFTGGRGFGLWLLWNAVSGDTKWDDPENEIIISSGPIGGITQYPGAGKSIVVTLSPTTGSVVDSNVGGYFGPLLKFAGWDAIEIRGKAEKDVIVYIDGNKGYVTIEEAPEEAIDTHLVVEQFTNMYADSQEDKRNIAVVSSGSAADNTLIGMLNFSFFDVKRGVSRVKQAGRGGTGSVFRNKKIKALIVKFSGVKGDTNGPAEWLIFMDMVNKQIPTFEDKAEALHYFPMFRTWFGLNGLCKLPWNDIEPADNGQTSEPAKVPEHVKNYVDIFNGVTGKNITKEELIMQSERVYNFQRIFNLKMGFGTREYDAIPYRSVGPVTKEEYESREERYDKQLKELGYDIEEKTTEEKMKILREYRESQYQKLCDAVYKRRGWNSNGVPTLETVKRLGIDFPDVVELVSRYQ